MIKIIQKILYILPAKNIYLLFILLGFILTSLMEAVGIGIIGPFIALASNSSMIEKTPILVKVRNLLEIDRANEFVAFIGLLAILLFFVKTLVAWATQVFIARFSDRQQCLLMIRMTNYYLEAPYIYHITKNSSTIIDRLIEVANTFSNTIFMPLLTTFANIFLFIALFSLLCFTSPKIMIALLIALFPILIFFNSFAPKVRKWGQEMRDSKASIIQAVNHAFGSVKETKIIGCEKYFENQISYQAKKLERSHRTFVALKILPRFVLESTIVISVIAIISISVLLNEEGIGGTTSALGVFAIASIRLLPAITNSINGINQLRASSYTIDQIYYELWELSSIQKEYLIQEKQESLRKNNSETREFEFKDRITLEKIKYRYPNTDGDVIDDLSMSINKGESIAFIGKSGAGKTTLVDIILGLLVPQSGDLKVDGLSVYQDLRAWKNLIAYIPQTIFLIDDSIERNIAFGVPEHLIDREKLERAIRIAQLTEVVDNLANGIHTWVGERGVLLSGGQRQRVGIARAVYHDRQILVLDEATAALDNKTEKLVTDSIASLSSSEKITLITIAHRLTTVKDCDWVYLLSQGKIVKDGKFSEVVEDIEM